MTWRTNKLKNFAMSASLIAITQVSATVTAQESETDDTEFDEIVVVGSRLPNDVTSFAGSISVIGAEELTQQTKITTDLGDILGNSVPGMATSKGNSASNFSQMLRGRKPAVLIDGSPQTVPLRDAARDIRLISPSAIGRVEVIRGATALYGMGGAGGVINYITKRPTDEGYQFRTDVGFSTSLSNFDDDSFSYDVSQSITGKEGAFDFIVTALYQDTGQAFDADGTMIAPDPEIGQGGLSETETTSLFLKVGYDIGEDQRIEGSYGRYRAAQDTDYIANFTDSQTGYQTVVLKSAIVDATAYERGYLVDPLTNNDFASFSYTHEDILGSTVRLSANYQDYEAVFGYTPFFLWGLFPRDTNPAGGGQTVLRSEKIGFRLDVTTPIDAMNGRILWGVDYLKDTTQQDIYDSGDHYLSPVDQKDLSLFAQFEGDIIEGVNFRGGFRWVNFNADVGDYTTLPFYIDGYVENGAVVGGTTIIGGNAVQGGDLKYDIFLPNLGLVVDLSDNWKAFGSYSKGFLVADLGRLLRDRYDDNDIAQLQNDAQIVTNYEGGIRATYEDLSFELAAYRSTSDAGTNLEPIPGTGIIQVVRAPERVWGAEASIEWAVNDALNINASYSWVDGENDRDDDGVFEQMTTYRIPPQKFVTQVNYQMTEKWSLFLQGLYTFDHEPFGPNSSGFGRNPIDGFFLLDASVTGKVGPGFLSISASNLLNNDYFPVAAQSDRVDPTRYYKAAGAELTVRYSIEY